MNIRLRVVKTVTPVIQQKGSLNTYFDQAIESIDDKDRALFHELSFGTIRFFFELEHIAKQLLSKPFKTKDTDLLVTIVLGLYQIKFTRIPDHAAISETVDITRKLKKPWATKLINAVLRKYLRERDQLDTTVDTNLYAHPNWLAKKIRNAWPSNWQSILKANNIPAPLTLRTNRLKQTREQLANIIGKENIELTNSNESGIRLIKHQNLESISGYNEGHFSVQDEAAQLAANLMDLKTNHRVLDACCAPGGKTTHILETQPDIKKLIAVDLEETRMRRVEQNLSRLGLTAVLKVADILDLSSWWDGGLFDRILLDAPCSATGVIRRHPDIKLLRREDDLAKLQDLQRQLLTLLWQLLTPSGVLVYATCSILPEENVEVTASFIEAHPDAKEIPIGDSLGIRQEVGRQLFPTIGGHDGFYYARFIKN